MNARMQYEKKEKDQTHVVWVHLDPNKQSQVPETPFNKIAYT